ncbi:MAG: GNAT family N-acetyltransferase [Bacteroidales bacterium]|jgi:ribosomal protein S18 acetylase RimI-like enzyme|nr:GNAT family N-acetyltransferase [Bacteroidales bacterium]
MNKVNSYQEIVSKISEIRNYKKKYITNFYLDEARCNFLFEENCLFSALIGETYFIFQIDDNFYHLYYCSSDNESLKSDIKSFIDQYHENKIIMVDIIGNEEQIVPVKTNFMESGFTSYQLLNRMSKVTIPDDIVELEDKNIISATNKDIVVVKNYLDEFFDKYSEQIPTLKELQIWTKEDSILVYKKNNVILGFIIFEIKGVTSYLRYWFVHPEYRENKIGAKLLKEYFLKSKNTKRQLFWVITSNENAIKRYVHYGFLPEKIYDEILMYKK